ncbi:MAG: DOPA 4,5-dioxygenase family protein [Pseudomonadota bacterium]
MKDPADIKSYHVHVYFDEDSIDRARAVVDAACEAFTVERGRMHEKPVGPHPMWSCQLAMSPEVFAVLLPWMALNRDGLIVFSHPETEDFVADHRDHAIWLGGCPPLRLEVFWRRARATVMTSCRPLPKA